MKKRIAWAVFTYTDFNRKKDYLVKGNFGNDKKAAEKWKSDHEYMFNAVKCGMEYPHGLFVKKVTY